MKHGKAKNGKDELEKYRKELVRDIERWQHINEHGCNDPFWTDGSNMNLVRNHVIYHKRIILDICQETGKPLPDEYYLATPPRVSNYYMNNLKQKRRVERILSKCDGVTTKRMKYDPEQLTLF